MTDPNKQLEDLLNDMVSAYADKQIASQASVNAPRPTPA